jgi:hypothetical protein
VIDAGASDPLGLDLFPQLARGHIEKFGGFGQIVCDHRGVLPVLLSDRFSSGP